MIIDDSVIKKLSQPISKDKVCGEFLKKDRTKYRPLRNLFNQAKTSIKSLTDNPDNSQIENLKEENHTHWTELSEHCIKSLMNDTKDIELLGWLITSQLIIDKSFLGFSLSFMLLNDLLKRYWEDINPMPLMENDNELTSDGIEHDIISTKVRFLSQIFGESKDNGLLFIPLRLSTLIGSLTLSEYIKEKNNGNLAAIKTEQKKKFNITKEVEEKKIRNINVAINSINEIKEFILDKIEGKFITPPAFKYIIQELINTKEAILFIADIVEINNPTEHAIEEEHNPATNNSNSTAPNTLIQNVHTISDRNHAFAQLRIISNYFKIHEPHSPIAFLLEKSIRWGNLSLPELLEEWFKDGKASLEDMFNLAGLNDKHKDKQE